MQRRRPGPGRAFVNAAMLILGMSGAALVLLGSTALGLGCVTYLPYLAAALIAVACMVAMGRAAASRPAPSALPGYGQDDRGPSTTGSGKA